MLPYYKTVKSSSAHEIVIQKSRFIAHTARVESADEAIAFIDQIKKQHWNATHNCSAYMIGEHDHIQKANDDGEPSGTAGVPILEVIKKRELKDTAIVVTRYFGGIKLGAGGLIRAYGKAASEGLNAAGIVERRLMKIVTASIDYTWLGKIENELRASVYELKEIRYAEGVDVDVFVEEEQVDAFCSWITELTNGQAVFSEGDVLYMEKTVEF
ncbi:YigZ family protein [Domibacillus robiginosus]|uniref:YigZ family protein n=1 Tax=Domibacillus robiginosus TaxID=1071054 RepID=UPI00067B6FBA|nr:YigZ family protein [Domibacillus robiginosus]